MKPKTTRKKLRPVFRGGPVIDDVIYWTPFDMEKLVDAEGKALPQKLIGWMRDIQTRR